MTRPTHPLQAGAVADAKTVAAAWMARKRSGEMTEQDARDLKVWLDRDSANRAAYELAERTWNLVASLRDDPVMLSLREQARNRVRREQMLWLASIAASAALLAGGFWFGKATGVIPEAPPPLKQEFRTEVGQRATIALADGSQVTLDTDSIVRTYDDRRRRLVELTKGRAFFRVAPDHKRPFVVRVGSKTVTATGTAFSVRNEPNRFEVALAEGRVRVVAPMIRPDGTQAHVRKAEVVEMRPGYRLATAEGRKWTLTPVDVAEETRWLTGKLAFKAKPLADVVFEMNRYSEKKIVIADPSIADTPVSGGFRAGDVDAFVAALQGYKLARVRANDDTVVEIVAR